MKRWLFAAITLLCLAVTPSLAQTPTPVTSTLNFQIGASAFGLGGSSSATAASDIVLTLNPGLSGFLANLEVRSDNLLAPGAYLQYYGGGGNVCLFGKCPYAKTKALPGILAPLTFYAEVSAGLSRIVPATGSSSSHFGGMFGGGLKWQTSSGVYVDVIHVADCHFTGAPWGNNTPCYSGGIGYLWGSH